MHFQIRGMSKGLRGQLFRIDPEQPLLIGRARNAGVCLDDPTISRRHCILRQDGENLLVRDQNTVNGTFVNGVRLMAIERRLAPRDILQVGKTAFVVEQIDDATADAPIYVSVSGHA
jgi:pSer/pThr/pTyr-binding forkhead associated (FHA) protein